MLAKAPWPACSPEFTRIYVLVSALFGSEILTDILETRG